LRLPLDIRARLTEIGGAEDGAIDLFESALVLAAADRPRARLEPYRRHMEGIISEVRTYVGGTEPLVPLGLRIEGLVQVIIKRYGYGGTQEVFDDLDAVNMMRVIDSRSGMPIVIGILFMQTARTLGWDICGLDFPGRFLVRLEAGGERRILDPFAGGAVVEPRDMRDMFKAIAGNHVELRAEHYRDMGNRDILLRLQENIKIRLLREERFDDALETLEVMLLFAPDKLELWRETGLLHARLDHIKDAIRALEEYLRRCGTDETRYNTSMLLQELRARLN
jgi:regulator of sirC expression with transglutaminase-like and TPR domain